MLFSVLEEHLVEWVDRANEQHVVISDEVPRSATENSNRQGEREGVFHIFTVTGKGRGGDCFLFLLRQARGEGVFFIYLLAHLVKQILFIR